MFTERQRDFLKAASDIAAHQGLNRLTIRNVAAKVGVTEPAVYRHFANKLDLLTGVLDDLQETIRPHFSLLWENRDMDTQQQLRTFLEGMFRELEQRPAYAVFVFSEDLFHAEPQLAEKISGMLKSNLKFLADSIRRIQDDGRFRDDIASEEIATVIMGVVRLEITRWHLVRGVRSLADRADGVARMLAALFQQC